ncbi:MAG: tetratricopeptide repeat protein [Acidobacteria bacterium]|nr:tetratricopeptide repeat protein [Acidobacteriota bacterium]
MRNRPHNFVAMAVIAVICLFCVQASLRRSFAEHWIANPKPEGLELAVQLTPGNGEGWIRLGQALTGRGDDPQRAMAAIRRGVELGPYNPEAWIALGLQTEGQGDPKLAEQHFKKAFEVDHSFEARWSLANFYLRQGQTEEFWHWIRETISFSPRGFYPGVELCWRASDDHAAILENAIADHPDLNRRYFAYLRGSGRVEAAAAVWERVKDGLIEADRVDALWLLEAWLRQGRVSGALDIWNRLIRAALVPYEPLSPETGVVLTNADLRQTPTGNGFDWALFPSDDIRPEIELLGAERNVVVFHFSGRQDQSSPLLRQFVPLQPGVKYRFDFRYSTDDLASNTGVRWTAYAGITEDTHILAKTEALAASPDMQMMSFDITAPKEGLISLALEYERFPGTTRKSGRFRTGYFAFYPVDKEAPR